MSFKTWWPVICREAECSSIVVFSPSKRASSSFSSRTSPEYFLRMVTRREWPFLMSEYTGSCWFAVLANWKGNVSVPPRGPSQPLHDTKVGCQCLQTQYSQIIIFRGTYEGVSDLGSVCKGYFKVITRFGAGYSCISKWCQNKGVRTQIKANRSQAWT